MPPRRWCNVYKVLTVVLRLLVSDRTSLASLVITLTGVRVSGLYWWFVQLEVTITEHLAVGWRMLGELLCEACLLPDDVATV